MATCKQCEQPDLKWEKRDGHWVLLEQRSRRAFRGAPGLKSWEPHRTYCMAVNFNGRKWHE